MLKTPITPPRVAFVDPQTGNVSREWYMFFLSLYQAIDGSDLSLTDLQKGPAAADVSSLLAAASADVSPPVITPELVVNDPTVELQPSSSGLLERIAELQQQLDLLSKQARSELGTLAPVNIDSVPYIGFDTAPSWIGSKSGQLWFDPNTNQLNVKQNQVTQQIGEELFRYGKASSAISDTNLQLVYKTGVVGASGVIKFAPAVAGITDPDQIIGIATESIALNGFGRVTTFGVVHGVNTTGSAYSETWADNDDIWYDPVTGGLTKTKPVAPNIKLMVGTVINAGAGSGSFSVKIGSTSELGGTDSNVQLGSLADKDLLQYNGTYWENVTSSDALNVAIKDEGTTLTTTPTSIDFVGAGVVATTVGNDVTVTITGGGGGGGGTVTNITGVNSNGFSWSIANPTTTPALTLSTTVNGIAIGNGTSFSNLTIGTGLTYSSSTLSVTGLPAATKNILASDGSSGVRGVTIGTGLNYDTTTNTLSNTASGSVISVSATAPVASTGGTTPVISMTAANGSTDGYLTSTDWNTFNNKQPAGSYLVNGGALGTPSSGTLTNCTLPYTGLTGTVPTWNQNTTGSAAKWTTARLLAGNSVDGSGNVPFANAFIIQQADGSLTGAQNIGLLTTGVMKNTVTAGVGIISTATAGTDYAPPTSGSSILYGNGSGGFSNATVGSGLSFSGGVLNTVSGPPGSGTVTNTAGALTANSAVVGNGTSDIKTLDNVKIFSTDTGLPPAPTIFGKIYYNYSGATWHPACAATSANYADKNSYFPAIGLSSRGTAAQCWNTSVFDYFSIGLTDSALYNSHYVPYGAAIGIPASLGSSTSPSGSWNDPPMSAGIPTDPYYTEIGGIAITLGVGTKGNYAEGAGIVVKDTPVFGGTPVEARLTGVQMGLQKDDPHNTWKSYGFMSYSMGAQQTTYAPLAAYAIAGGWQYGLDLSAGAYNQADIKFQSGTITSSASQLYINVGGSQAASFSSVGIGTNYIQTNNFRWNTYLIAAPAGSTTTYLRNDGTWATPALTGAVTSVTATAPVQSTGGTTPVISMPVASTGTSGYLSAADWDKFNGKAPATSGSSVLSGNGSGGFSNVVIGTGLTYNTSTNTLSTSGVVQIAGGASNNDYLYSVGTGTSPSDPINRAGWLKISNNAGSSVWIPFYL